MSIQHTSRTGKTYYLHVGTTKTGKPKYFFSLKQNGASGDTIPDGFEIYENVSGQVFMRKIPKQIIHPKELARVEAALRRHATAWQYIAEVKKDTITVHECATNLDGLDEMAMLFSLRPLSDEAKSRFRNYVAVLRFVLDDKESRTFVTERFCFRGSVNRWIYLDGPASLPNQLNKYIKHLGCESMYDLF